jgi:hypothetical protein
MKCPECGSELEPSNITLKDGTPIFLICKNCKPEKEHCDAKGAGLSDNECYRPIAFGSKSLRGMGLCRQHLRMIDAKTSHEKKADGEKDG